MRLFAMVWFAAVVAASPALAAGEWEAVKDVGAASGQRECFISSPSIDVSVMLTKYPDRADVFRAVIIGSKIDPTSYSYLAVGGRRFKTDDGGFSGSDAETIIALLAEHDTVAFEWDEWPTSEHHEGTIPTANFESLLVDCETWVLQ